MTSNDNEMMVFPDDPVVPAGLLEPPALCANSLSMPWPSRIRTKMTRDGFSRRS